MGTWNWNDHVNQHAALWAWVSFVFGTFAIVFLARVPVLSCTLYYAFQMTFGTTVGAPAIDFDPWTVGQFAWTSTRGRRQHLVQKKRGRGNVKSN
jgi:hypothetical protein